MRILLDATALHGRVGGVETHLVNLLDAWEAAGPEDEFLVFTTNDATPAFRDIAKRRGSLHLVGGNNFPTRFAMQQAMLRYAMAKHSPDVLLAATPVMPMLPSRVPVVAVVHDFRYIANPQEFSRLQVLYRKLAYTYCYRHAQSLIAISETTRDTLVDVYPETAARASIVYHGADHVDRWPQAPESPKQAIAFGHWSNKQPDLAIRVWAALRGLIEGFDWKLNIVGTDAETRTNLTSLTARLGLSSLVIVHPFVPHEQFQQLFSASSLLLFPSTAEGFGFPIVEAMRLGIPIVASDLPALQEVAADVALYAHPGSVDDFTQQCRRIIEDGALSSTLQHRGLERSQTFTWRRCADQTRVVLQEAAGLATQMGVGVAA